MANLEQYNQFYHSKTWHFCANTHVVKPKRKLRFSSQSRSQATTMSFCLNNVCILRYNSLKSRFFCPYRKCSSDISFHKLEITTWIYKKPATSATYYS